MKTRTFTDDELDEGFDGVPAPRARPERPDFSSAAAAIIAETESDKQLPAIECAARLAGADLLLAVESGEVDGKLAYDFLKNLFERKTPAPVQRIEQRTHADFRVLFQAAVQDNPNVLEESLARAEAAHLAIQERLSLPPSLELPPCVVDKAEVFDETRDVSLEWKPGQEPAEITRVRAGEIVTKPMKKEVTIDEPLSDRHRRFIEVLRGGR